MQGIYKITNKINGHCYIGSSVDIKKRWRAHRAKSVRNKEDNKNNYVSSSCVNSNLCYICSNTF